MTSSLIKKNDNSAFFFSLRLYLSYLVFSVAFEHSVLFIWLYNNEKIKVRDEL
jgi:hypothetical protein